MTALYIMYYMIYLLNTKYFKLWSGAPSSLDFHLGILNLILSSISVCVNFS